MMERAIDAFYWPTAMWAEYPALTLLPVLAFAAAFWHARRMKRSRALLVVTVLWGLYAVYEGAMWLWSRQVIAPIRIDLIVLGPLMYAVTAAGVLAWWRARPT